MSLIGKKIGNYNVRSKLGEGGMGTVYLGEHPLIGKKVAIKVLLEELAQKEDIVERFFNEARAVNDIGHQNIVDIVDFGKVSIEPGLPDTVYFIMEFLEGESLSDRIRRAGLKMPEVLHIMQQACSALFASHKKGIVHRDLKPENIHLVHRGDDALFVKLLDFGIAKLTGDSSMSSSKTRTGLVIGTPTYMSPEQCEGKGQIDHRSDVYSLGVVMYELVTGRVPFPGDGFGEILVAHLTRQPDAPSKLNPAIPPEIEAIVLHAIEKDKNRRFQTMEEFLIACRDPARHMQQYRPLPGYTPTNAGATMMMDGPVAITPPMPTGSARGPLVTAIARPTTLSGAAAEVDGQPSGKSRRGAVIGISAVAAIALAVGAVFLLKKPATEPEAGVVAAVAPPAKKESGTIRVTINSDPSGATIIRADTGKPEPGVTPITFEVDRGGPTFDVRVKKEGFKPGQVTVGTDHDQALLVPLDEVPAAEKPVAVAPPINGTAPVVEPVVVKDKKPVKITTAAPKDKESSSHSSDRVKESKPKVDKVATPKATKDKIDDTTMMKVNF